MPFDLAESFVIETERQLGAELPVAYRNSMRIQNGGELEVGEEVWQQYPIADASDRKRLARTANHVLKETAVCLGWLGFPPNALAIAGNGSGDQLVFLKVDDAFQPEVYLWLHETHVLQQVAHDFSEIKGRR